MGENMGAGVGCWRQIGLVRNINDMMVYFIRA